MHARFKSRKSVRLAGLTFALATSVSVALVEAGARWLGVAPAVDLRLNLVSDPFLPWKPKPHSSARGVSRHREFSYHHVHNSQGFRDTEHTWRKPAGVFRIVGIGDSFTYGVGADFEKTYLAQLEERLNDGGSAPVEIVKLGVPRYWPEPERLMLQHYGLRYEPDLVLVGVIPNDVYDTATGVEGLRVSDGFLVTREAERLGRGVQWLYVHSYAARAVLRRFLRGRPAEAEELKDREQIWQRIHAEHRKMVHLARGAAAEIAFVHIPHPSPWGAGAQDVPRRLEQFCRDEECHFIDVLPDMKRHPDPASLYHPKDAHCTAAGYEVVAQVIYRELAAHALVP